MLSRSDLEGLTPEQKRLLVGALLESRRSRPQSFPLSHAQEQLWFMDRLQPGSPVYNIPLYLPFEGDLEVGVLRSALEELMRRHDMLRVRFELVAGEPVQIVEPAVEVDLRLEDLSHLPEGERDAALGRALNREVQQPFDLSAGPCVRYKLFHLRSRRQHLLSVTMHHIVTDAWSLGIFVSELRAIHDAHRQGREAVLPPVQVDYCDYAAWQREHLRGMRMSKLIRFWTDQLEGAPQLLRLPTDRPRPQDQTFNGTVAGFVFAEEASDRLIEFSRRHKVTLFMVLLACYYVLLYRYTGQEDLLVGAPVANRAHQELESIIGLFVNTLILRIRVEEDETFASLLAKVQAMSLDAFEHQALPFERLVDELRVERVPGFSPLYQVVFNFQNAALIESENPRAEGETMQAGDFPFVHSNTAKVDVNLTITQSGTRISGGIEYNTDLFERTTIEGMLAHFQAIAEHVLSAPQVPLLEIPLAGEAAAEPEQPAEAEDFNFEAGGLA